MLSFPIFASLFVLSGIFSAAIIAVDLTKRSQSMSIMNPVWILTGLWAGLPALWAYYAFGRQKPLKPQAMNLGQKGNSETSNMKGMMMHEMDNMKDMNTFEKNNPINMQQGSPEMNPQKQMDMSSSQNSMRMNMMHEMNNMENISSSQKNNPTKMQQASPEMHPEKQMAMSASQNSMDMTMHMNRPQWQSVVLSTLHCGAGCTLADLIGEGFFFFVPIAIGGSMLAANWTIDYLLALVLGIGFQYAAIKQMQPSIPFQQILARAAKADILSLSAWQLGMYLFLAIVIFTSSHFPARDSFSFWFLMQIAMYAGFILALPVNIWLIRKGIKKGM